jgi:hypothetical protein
MPTAQAADFSTLFRVQCTVAKEQLAGGFSGLVFSVVPASWKSSEKTAERSVFRQRHRGCMSGLAYKIE